VEADGKFKTMDAPPEKGSVVDRLFSEGHAFDFFQAVRLLERVDPRRRPVGHGGPPRVEAARFRVFQSLSFPPSSIFEISPPTPETPFPAVTVAFMGLTGPAGVLPRHYTEQVLRLERESKAREKRALRDWLDLFNHRLLALFYRAWEKYRFYLPYERGESTRAAPDAFTRALFSLIGLGEPALRNRLRVALRADAEGGQPEEILGVVDDLVLLHYGGLLARRPRCAVGLEAMLTDYFQLPARVQQFQGQWLQLEEADQCRLNGGGCLGENTVAGSRVWDVQGKIRLWIGPLRYQDYEEFLPDRAPSRRRKTFFVLVHLVRLYLGPEIDFDVQLVLRAEDVPACRLAESEGMGPRLGWNTWVHTQGLDHDADDAVFEGEEVNWINRA
jgi:type VI secretion system protein ImpH